MGMAPWVLYYSRHSPPVRAPGAPSRLLNSNPRIPEGCPDVVEAETTSLPNNYHQPGHTLLGSKKALVATRAGFPTTGPLPLTTYIPIADLLSPNPHSSAKNHARLMCTRTTWQLNLRRMPLE